MRDAIEYDPDDFTAARQRELDKNLLVKFEYKPLQDKKASLAEGRPIFKDTLYIDIRTPGDRDGIRRPATERDIQRFSQHYELFMKRVGDADQVEGTPLTEWPQIGRSTVEELAFFHIKTVEQLANVSDSNAQNMRGVAMLKQKAREWLEANKGKAELEAQNAALQAELKVRDDRLAKLEAALAEMQSRPTIKPKPRGRPKKVTADASATDSDSQ